MTAVLAPEKKTKKKGKNQAKIGPPIAHYYDLIKGGDVAFCGYRLKQVKPPDDAVMCVVCVDLAKRDPRFRS